MTAHHTIRIVQTIVTTVAVLFGVATLFAGGRVLLGSDPGYEVFRPLLTHNTAMGVAYLVWRPRNPLMIRERLLLAVPVPLSLEQPRGTSSRLNGCRRSDSHKRLPRVKEISGTPH